MLKNTLIIMSAVILTALTIVTLKYTSFLSASATSPFPDVPENSDRFTAIKYLNEQDILRGNQDGTFKPKSTLNRAEWAAILSRLAGAEPDIENYNNCFPDVKEEWFAPYVCLAKDQGWVNGYSAGELAGLYAPQRSVQDIEVLATLATLTGWEMEDSEIWYEPALKYALDHNIYDESDPILDITRENMADIIFRMIATVSLGNDKYSSDLDNDVKAGKLYEILNIELINYKGEYLTTELSVKSGDGTAELILTQNDLPEGVEKSDISLRKVELADNSSEEILAFYNFEPDGLVFENPVQVNIAVDYDPDSIPMLFHIVNENLEPVKNLEISVNEEKNSYNITADIDSFSNYMLVGGIFKVASVDPGERRVGEIFFMPLIVTYPTTDKIVLVAKFPGLEGEAAEEDERNPVLKWIVRLDKQFFSAVWKASLEYDPLSVIDSPPTTEITGGSFIHQQEFRCVSTGKEFGLKGPGFIEPDVIMHYNYNLLDENDVPGPSFTDFGHVKLWLTGTCVMPEAENLEIKTTCGGSLSVSGNLDRYQVETEKIQVFIKEAGPNGAFVSFDDASYTINGGKFSYSTGLDPGKYEVGVSALMVGAYTTFPVTENQGFEIKECEEKEEPELEPCEIGLTLCSGECVDFQNDDNNCSACGVVCNEGTSCSEGGCYDDDYYNYGTGIYDE